MKRAAVFQTVIGGLLVAVVSGAAVAAPCGMGKNYGGAYASPMPAYPGYRPYGRAPYGAPPRPMMMPYGPAAGMPMPYYAPAAPMPSPSTAANPAKAGMTATADSVVATEAAAVTISDMRYDAPTVSVKKGGVVTWTNNGAMPHTVTASNGSFGSPQLSNGASWSRTFDETGTFGYYCSLHPGMRGTVVVVD